jgi:hypothetical protein
LDKADVKVSSDENVVVGYDIRLDRAKESEKECLLPILLPRRKIGLQLY